MQLRFGGGGQPAGGARQIQYHDGGSPAGFAGDPEFLFDPILRQMLVPYGSEAAPSLAFNSGSGFHLQENSPTDQIIAAAIAGRDKGAIWGAPQYSEVYAWYDVDEAGESWVQAYSGADVNRTQVGVGAFGDTYGGTFGGVSQDGMALLLARRATSLGIATDNAAPIHLYTDGERRVTIPAAGGLNLLSGQFVLPVNAGDHSVPDVTVDGFLDSGVGFDPVSGYPLYVTTGGNVVSEFYGDADISEASTVAPPGGKSALFAAYTNASPFGFSVFGTHGASVTGNLFGVARASTSVLYSNATVNGLMLGTVNATPMRFATSDTLQWEVTAAGHFAPISNAGRDLGLHAGQHVRSGFFQGTLANYDTFTDSSNYARLQMVFSSGYWQIRHLPVGSGVAVGIAIMPGGSNGWMFTTSSHLTPNVSTDASDIGTSALRIRDVYQRGTLYNYNNTDTTNYERGSIGWSSDTFRVMTGQGGSGTARGLVLGTTGAAGCFIFTSGVSRWQVDSNGHVVPSANATYSIGATGSHVLNVTLQGAITNYNSYTNPSNYERGSFAFSGNVLTIGTSNAGTGVARGIQFMVGGSNVWSIHPTTAAFYPNTADTYDVGSTNNRIRDLYQRGAIYSYNGAPSGSDWERGRIYWASNFFTIMAEKSGTGTTRGIRFAIDSVNVWQISASTAGHLVPTTNGVTDVGSTSSHVKDGYFQGSIFNYGLFTDGSNYERIRLTVLTGEYYFTTESAGTGLPRSLIVGTGGAASLFFWTGGTSKWLINNTGNFMPGTTDAYDIGTSALRVKDVYQRGVLWNFNGADTTNYERMRALWSGNVFIIQTENGGTGTARNLRLVAASTFQMGSGAGAQWEIVASGSALRPTTGGTYELGAAAARVLTGFFGGSTVTTSTPMLNLAQTWNAGAQTFSGVLVNVTDSASAAGSLLANLQVGSATQFSVGKAGAVRVVSTGEYGFNTSGVVWKSGSGSPEGVVTAPVGSFYSRTDGGAATSWYVKESGAGNTGWVAK